MFNFLSHLFLYWHLQKRWSRRALALLSWRLGARQPCTGTRPAASFPLSLLILISCFRKCPMAALGISLGGFSPARQKAPGGPWVCTWGRRGVGLGSLAAGKGIKLPAGLCCCCPGAVAHPRFSPGDVSSSICPLHKQSPLHNPALGAGKGRVPWGVCASRAPRAPPRLGAAIAGRAPSMGCLWGDPGSVSTPSCDWVKARGGGHGVGAGVSVPAALCLRGGVRGPVRQDPTGAQAGRVRQDHPPPPGDLPRAGRHHLC